MARRLLSRSAAFSRLARASLAARATAAVETGAPFGQDQPSLPISMLIAGRSLAEGAVGGKSSMLEVESGPR